MLRNTLISLGFWLTEEEKYFDYLATLDRKSKEVLTFDNWLRLKMNR